MKDKMTPITSHHLNAGGLQVSVTNYGASLQDLRLSSHDIPLVLGFTNASDYARGQHYLGATAGRVANRISPAEITIDGQTYQLEKNERGKQMLHGGSLGCGRALWDVASICDEAITFILDEPDGHMGFPGALHISCTYQVTGPQKLSIFYEAYCDKPSFVNLAHHSYFRLDHQPDISDHHLQIFADSYLPVDNDNIPTGMIVSVDNTVFDFRQMGKIGMREFDHNYCLSQSKKVRPVAQLYSPHSGIKMTLSSDQPGLQFYTSHHLDERADNHHGRAYRKFDGICLEPQIWPNSPNMPQAPCCLLRPGEVYTQRLDLQFSTSEITG
ncbi:MAG: aldose epimerase family protein [Candidatus Puniceispirillaceae bacterium]